MKASEFFLLWQGSCAFLTDNGVNSRCAGVTRVGTNIYKRLHGTEAYIDWETIWKYCLCYLAIHKFHIQSIYCKALTDGFYFHYFSVESAMTPTFLCFMITTYCYKKFRLNLNARSFFIVKNVSKSCKKL